MTRGIGVAVIAAGALVASRAAADEAAKPEDLELRLTLSTFLYRESGADAPPIVDQGAALGNASPIRRTFGDLRAELLAGGFTLDARIRQTTSERYQAGASAGGEYELRVLDQELGSHTTFVTIGRQVIDAVGATKIDGVALTHRLSDTVRATLFAGAFPQLGSRSLDTDYARIRRADGSDGPHLVPVTGGLGAAYQTPDYHGELGAAAVFAPQDVPDASASDKARVFTTSSGYWRPAAGLDLYHFALLDLVGGVHLTNGSAGIDARPIANLQLSASVHHVSVDLLQIAARGVLDDPDPSAIGVVQNNLALLRISQDAARGAVSLAFAQQRFELSASGGVRRRPRVDLALADGSGALAFREARSAEATFAILDRRSIAGLRLQLSGSLTFPLGSGATDRARGSLVRLSASRGFAQQRGQLEADVMAERFRDEGAGHCMTSLDPSLCYGNAKTTAAQAGALASWRIGREWLVIADLHAGYRDVRSAGIAGPIAWPLVTSITSFVRVQWRYR
ncbi:MAG: hypothetical protein ABIY55_02725 [Kofleriaceae bacterium]